MAVDLDEVADRSMLDVLLRRLVSDNVASEDAALGDLLAWYERKQLIVREALRDGTVTSKQALAFDVRVMAAIRAVPGLQLASNE